MANEQKEYMVYCHGTMLNDKRRNIMHYVYKYVLDGEIIYIGKSDAKKPFSRLRQHGISGDNIPCEYHSLIKSADIFYCELPNAIMTDVVESELIRRYKPKLNKDSKATSEWGGLAFVEPEWVEYRKKYTQEQRQELLEQVDLSRKSISRVQNIIEKLIFTKRAWDEHREWCKQNPNKEYVPNRIANKVIRYYENQGWSPVEDGGDDKLFVDIGEQKKTLIKGFTVSVDGILSYTSKPPVFIGNDYTNDYNFPDSLVLVDDEAWKRWLETECQPILEKLKDIEFEISNYRLSA